MFACVVMLSCIMDLEKESRLPSCFHVLRSLPCYVVVHLELRKVTYMRGFPVAYRMFNLDCVLHAISSLAPRL